MSAPVPMKETKHPVAPDPRRQVILVGALAGAALGAAVAYVLSRKIERPPKVTAGQALKVGMLLLGTARQLAALLEEAAEEA